MDLCFRTVLVVGWMGERGFGVGGRSGNRIFIF